MYTLRLFLALVTTLLVLAACAGQSTAGTASAPAVSIEDQATHDATMEGAASEDSMSDMSDDTAAMDGMADDAERDDTMNDAAGQMDDMSGETVARDDMVSEESIDHATAVKRPAWQQIALTDARTGKQFTLADYAGKTVFVEPFATWCSNCRRQLGYVQSAYSILGDEAVFIALSVEPNISNEELVDYANKQGFEYTFAAMPPEMLQELSALFGRTIANPPATPHFIVRPDGSTTELVTGFEEPEVLVEQIESTVG